MGQRGLCFWGAAAAGTRVHVPCECMSVCAVASKHQTGLAVDRTKDLGAGYLSGCDLVLDTEETGGSQSFATGATRRSKPAIGKTAVSGAWLPLRP